MESNVVQGAFTPRRWWQAKWLQLSVVGVIVAAALVTYVVMLVHHRNDQRAAKVQQQSLQTELARIVLDSRSEDRTVQVTTALINGAKSKRFSIGKTQLAQVYLDRANAYSSLSEYTPALADYKQAIATDSSLSIGALEGELEAQYHLHNTTALVPILKQLVTLLHNTQMPLANGQAAQYQADIDAIQKGQEVQL